VIRRQQILELLRVGHPAFDDDEIAVRLEMNRHFVNQVCRGLAADGLIARSVGPQGKLVNRLLSVPEERANAASASQRSSTSGGQTSRSHPNVTALISDFEACVAQSESSNAFPGPSLYFHMRALARRSLHATTEELLADDLFLEYVYAVLPAWGMHRMGNQSAKVVDFEDMAASLRSAALQIEALRPLDITTVDPNDAERLADDIWNVISALRVSRSQTRIVAGSKALHHVLPELVPPIDRQYTFRFFTGQKAVSRGDRQAFLDWFPLLCEIGRRCSGPIAATLERGGAMATSRSKVIDNAIIGFMQRKDARRSAMP
jgi:hypothetical protein